MVLFDSPLNNDNRNYNYSGFQDQERPEYSIISNLIESNSKIIDLGCGNGALLELLVKNKKIIPEGIESSESGVAICRKKNLLVHRGRIDESLPFADNSFDYAICNVTMQMVLYPEVLLKEMKRVARRQIISFPNFAFWRNRIDLLFHGRMPVPMLFGYEWYSTGHIHQFSVKDFKMLVNETEGLAITGVYFHKSNNSVKNFLMRLFPNLFQLVPIYLLEKEL